jgi:hypothetical protein
MPENISKRPWLESHPDLFEFVENNEVDEWATIAWKIAIKEGLLTQSQYDEALIEVRKPDSIDQKKYRKSYFQLVKTADPNNILHKLGFFDLIKPNKYFEYRIANLIRNDEQRRGSIISMLANNFPSDWRQLALVPNKFDYQIGTYLKFIQIPLNEVGIINFANNFGFLGDGITYFQHEIDYEFYIEDNLLSPKRSFMDYGEFLDDWYKEITTMKDHFLLWKSIKDKNLDFMNKYIIVEERDIFHFERFVSPTLPNVEYTQVGGFSGITEVDKVRNLEYLAKVFLERGFTKLKETYPSLKLEKNKFHITHESQSLLAKMWFEFAQAVSNNSEFRQCESCGKFFSVGELKNSRRDRRFCKGGTCRWRNHDKQKKAKSKNS